ncbi:MAG: UDP-N-acetylmuramate dehydrogenase [Anaerolineae bacterium]
MEDRLESLAQALRRLGFRPVPREPMARHTSFHIGGPADLWVAVRGEAQLAEAVQVARRAQVPSLVLGGGTNILVADRGVRGLVIANQARWQEPVQENGATATTFRVDCGVPLARLARWAVQKGLAGLEWAVGIPGSVGGAVVGNAGAYGGCVADVLERVAILDVEGVRRWLERQDLEFGYRTSTFKEAQVRPVLLSVEMHLRGDAPERLQNLAREYEERRRATQPSGASAGSIFRNPEAVSAGKLIEEAGLKGRRVGDAVVSEKHANYILNAGSATAEEVWALICQVQEEVGRRFGVHLEPEIERIGEWG